MVEISTLRRLIMLDMISVLVWMGLTALSLSLCLQGLACQTLKQYVLMILGSGGLLASFVWALNNVLLAWIFITGLAIFTFAVLLGAVIGLLKLLRDKREYEQSKAAREYFDQLPPKLQQRLRQKALDWQANLDPPRHYAEELLIVRYIIAIGMVSGKSEE